jgi:hypothetical protein
LDCHGCDLSEVAELTRHYRVQALVAYRSHIAYALARKVRPNLIIAAACEDRLIKALRSVPEIPALLSPLTSMERRCVNAHSDLEWLRRQLELACSFGYEPESAGISRSDPLTGKRKAVRSAGG